MTKDALEKIKDLLNEYDIVLRHKCEVYARQMADWVGVSDSKAKECAEEYRRYDERRLTIRGALIDIDLALDAKAANSLAQNFVPAIEKENDHGRAINCKNDTRGI